MIFYVLILYFTFYLETNCDSTDSTHLFKENQFSKGGEEYKQNKSLLPFNYTNFKRGSRSIIDIDDINKFKDVIDPYQKIYGQANKADKKVTISDIIYYLIGKPKYLTKNLLYGEPDEDELNKRIEYFFNDAVLRVRFRSYESRIGFIRENSKEKDEIIEKLITTLHDLITFAEKMPNKH